MKPRSNIKDSLANIAKSWPRPGELVFFVESDHVWLHKLRIPLHLRRQGFATKKMCEIIHLCDKHNLSISLTADPANSIEGDSLNPGMYDLVKWYMRFGFKPLGHSEDGFLMDRKPSQSTIDSIYQDYISNKKNDMCYEEFEKLFPKTDFRQFKLT